MCDHFYIKIFLIDISKSLDLRQKYLIFFHISGFLPLVFHCLKICIALSGTLHPIALYKADSLHLMKTL